jgi:hypothetical protein
MVIDAELGTEDHGSIPRNCGREGVKPLDARTNSEPDFSGGENKKK